MQWKQETYARINQGVDMICYKDKTFCSMHLLCKKGYNCDRALTNQIKEDAERAGLPIACYSAFPECFVRLWESDVKEKA